MYKIKFIAYLIILSLAATACAKKEKEEPAIVIGKIKVTKLEFENAFERFNFDKQADIEARKAFLENYIDRKLILKEAENLGLDKNEEFLQNVQDFWQQSLIKLTLDKKTKELFLSIRVSDKEISDFYKDHKNDFAAKDLSSVYGEIKLILLKEKQKKAVSDWLDSLRKKTNIKVDYKLLGLE
jgi:hypothetical protein